MKSLVAKFDSEKELTCRFFEITLEDKELKSKEDAGFAIVIPSLNMLILSTSKDIILTKDEERKLSTAIWNLYETASEIGFVVDIVSKNIQISMK